MHCTFGQKKKEHLVLTFVSRGCEGVTKEYHFLNHRRPISNYWRELECTHFDVLLIEQIFWQRNASKGHGWSKWDDGVARERCCRASCWMGSNEGKFTRRSVVVVVVGHHHLIWESTEGPHSPATAESVYYIVSSPSTHIIHLQTALANL